MTNTDHLQNIARAGLELALTDECSANEHDLLVVLLAIEDILDKGRGLILRQDYEGPKSKIVANMEAVRARIGALLKAMDPAEAQALLVSRGESLKTQFHITTA